MLKYHQQEKNHQEFVWDNEHLKMLTDIIPHTSVTELADVIPIDEILKKIDKMNKKTRKGEKWTDEEERDLWSSLRKKFPIEQIAYIHLRTPSSIASRLRVMASNRVMHSMDPELLAKLLDEELEIAKTLVSLF